MAMAKHLGKVVTPEVAAQIEAEVFYEPDRSIDTARFAPVQYRDYVIQAESFRLIYDDLVPLHEMHWLETEGYRHGLALCPNVEGVMARERAGKVLQFTVRKAGVLVGHLRMFLFKSDHTSTDVSAEDTLFLHPDHRGSFLVMGLVRYAENALRQFAPIEIRTNSKAANRADVLMRRMGYDLVAYQFVKFLKENDHVQ